jgi:hypothetical protein
MFRRGFRARQDERVLRLFAFVLGISSGVYIFKDTFEKQQKEEVVKKQAEKKSE